MATLQSCSNSLTFQDIAREYLRSIGVSTLVTAGLTKTRRADGPDDRSDGMARDGPPAHARVWRASGPFAKTMGRLICDGPHQNQS